MNDDHGLATVVEPPAGTAHLTLRIADSIDAATLCGRWTLGLEERTHAATSCPSCAVAAQERQERLEASLERALGSWWRRT